jgi:hypothetical protein
VYKSGKMLRSLVFIYSTYFTIYSIIIRRSMVFAVCYSPLRRVLWFSYTGTVQYNIPYCYPPFNGFRRFASRRSVVSHFCYSRSVVLAVFLFTFRSFGVFYLQFRSFRRSVIRCSLFSPPSYSPTGYSTF